MRHPARCLLAVLLLGGMVTACGEDSGPPTESTQAAIADRTAVVPDPVPSPEPEPEPEPTTTTTTFVPGGSDDPSGPILCEWLPHPAHHRPCPSPAQPKSVTATKSSSALAPPSKSSSPATYSGECSAVPAGIVAGESGCRNIPNAAGSGCDGYYQICKGTWDNYEGYPDAMSAPKHVQDAKAAELAAEPNGLCRHWAATGGCNY